jgi:nucleotide-binding universal stress UspA family protein
MELPLVIQVANSAFEPECEENFPVQAETLRRWCTPKVILAVTDLTDEEALLFEAIRQARHSAAKVLLVHVLQSAHQSFRVGHRSGREQNGISAVTARATLERMARQLRWVGIQCEPILLKGTPSEEISILAKTHGAQRILTTVQGGRDEKDNVQKKIAEEILGRVEIPVCTIGHYAKSPPRRELAYGRIVLALSLHSDCTIPMAFASRLAQENKASLTVIHVFEGKDHCLQHFGRTPLSVALRLPQSVLKEAELFCSLEFSVREGNPAAEILKHCNNAEQDFIVLGLTGPRPNDPSQSANVLRGILTKATCPVIILSQRGAASCMNLGKLMPWPEPANDVRSGMSNDVGSRELFFG